MEKIKIIKDSAGERLDIFLIAKIKNTSRSQLQKQIKAGRISVNSKTVLPHYFLKKNDIIEIKDASPEKKENIKIKEEKNNKLRVASCELRGIIIQDTRDYLIVNKPAGISVHGATHMRETTLVELILKKYPLIAKVGYDPDRPGIVHRLDKDVSGIMVIAKTQEAFDSLAAQFKTRSIEKKYTALVYGKIDNEEGMIDFPIERAAKGFKMAARTRSQGGKKSITEFRAIKKFINYTLLEVRIITGRTHQIRVHLSAYGHPVVGDNLYTTRNYREKNNKLGLERIFLASTELSFKGLDDKWRHYKIELPGEMQNFMKAIK